MATIRLTISAKGKYCTKDGVDCHLLRGPTLSDCDNTDPDGAPLCLAFQEDLTWVVDSQLALRCPQCLKGFGKVQIDPDFHQAPS